MLTPWSQTVTPSRLSTLSVWCKVWCLGGPRVHTVRTAQRVTHTYASAEAGMEPALCLLKGRVAPGPLRQVQISVCVQRGTVGCGGENLDSKAERRVPEPVCDGGRFLATL